MWERRAKKAWEAFSVSLYYWSVGGHGARTSAKWMVHAHTTLNHLVWSSLHGVLSRRGEPGQLALSMSNLMIKICKDVYHTHLWLKASRQNSSPFVIADYRFSTCSYSWLSILYMLSSLLVVYIVEFFWSCKMIEGSRPPYMDG